MILESLTDKDFITKGKKYLVIGISEDAKGKKQYEILDDNIMDFRLDDVVITYDYFVTKEYDSNLFKVIDDRKPAEWISKNYRTGLFKKVRYTGFDFILNNKAFYHRLSDALEPERSFFYYKLRDLYKEYSLGELLSGFTPIPEDHLINIKFPKDVLEEWVDSIDGKVFKGSK